MFQSFWNLLFFGLVTSLGIYTLHFSDKAASSSSPGINSGAVLAPPDRGKQHVLLTHGAGFIGAHIALALLEAGHTVTIVDENFSIRHLYKLLTAGTRLKKPKPSSPAKEAAVVCMEAVGEDAAACQPVTPLGHATLFRESAVRSCAATAPGFAAVILRHGSIMGADPHARLGQLGGRSSSKGDINADGSGLRDVIGTCVSAAVEGRQQQPYELPVPEGGSEGRFVYSTTAEDTAAAATPCFKEYVHVADLAAGFVAAIQEDCGRNPPSIYNVGSGQAVSYQQVMDACEKMFGVAPQVREESLHASHA
eukprot:gene4550-4802_t